MTRIVAFASSHVADAAAVIANAAARRDDPVLPAVLADASRVQGLLAAPSQNGLGVAAVDGERVLGFLLPLACVLWGDPAAYTAEWGWAAADGDMLTALYAAAAPRWVDQGRLLHAITVWADGPVLEEAWHGFGFGRVVVDAVRDLGPVKGRGGAVPVRRAGPEDAGTVARLERALWEHLAAPPVCRVCAPPGGPPDAARRLTDPTQPVWVAEAEGFAVGLLSLQVGGDAPAALRSPGLARCDGAFVADDFRRQGVAAALLAAALDWAREEGFTGCTVDFESANPEAAGFWPEAGFRPVLHSLARRVG